MRFVPVMSRKHSSIENFSTTGAYRRQMFMKAREFVSYSLKSGRANTSSGHLRRADEIGSPVTTPRRFAGIDFARMTPVRFSGSPPTADGIRRQVSLTELHPPRSLPREKRAVDVDVKNQSVGHCRHLRYLAGIIGGLRGYFT